MIEQELIEIEARAAAATPGPWKGDCRDGSVKYTVRGSDGTLVLRVDHKNGDFGFVGERERDDESFVLHARSDIPALVAEVRRLRAELAALSGALAYPNFDIERLADGRYEASAFEGKDPLGNRNAWAVGATPLEAVRALAAKWERGE
jgi:hypothetical protein